MKIYVGDCQIGDGGVERFGGMDWEGLEFLDFSNFHAIFRFQSNNSFRAQDSSIEEVS